MADSPLEYDERQYEVPIFDFGWGQNLVVPQMADEDAETYIHVKYEEWGQGDPEVSVKYVDGETTDRYRFRITNQDGLECSFKGGDPNELPVEVQHAVYSFGYSIRDLESIDQWMYRLAEAKEIVYELERLNEEYEDLPIVQFLIEDTLDAYRPITGFLVAKTALSDREYEALWANVMLSGSGQNGGNMIANFQANVLERLGEIDTPGLSVDGEAIEIRQGVELTEKDTENGHALFVDYATPFGVARCRFIEAGDGKYVCQHPDEGYLPPEMIRMLQERGKTVTNRESIENQETALQIVEHASLFADQLQDYPLSPDTTLLSQGESYEPINLATAGFERANTAAMSLVPLDLDEDVARLLQDKICEKVGVHSANQLSQSNHEKMVTTFFEALPGELIRKFQEYMESHEAYSRPEQGTF